MVDLSKKVKLIQPYKEKPLRDFDKDPLFVESDGHVLKVTNNEVLHMKEFCPRCRDAN